MKKIFYFLMGVVASLMIVVACPVNADASNWQFFDMTYQFDSVQIAMPDGDTVKGKVESWKDYENRDVVQVKVGGKTYLTHYSNVVLIDE